MSLIFAIFIVLFPMISFIIVLLWDYHNFKIEMDEMDKEISRISKEMD